MKGETGLPSRLSHAILDTYLNRAVGIIGCRSTGIARNNCEYDVLVVSDEPGPATTVKMGEDFVDLFFVTEKEVLKPEKPEVAVSLASLICVRDSSWVLSTASSACRATLHESARQCAEARLASSLKFAGRADEAISTGGDVDADFWLLSASYELAHAWLYVDGVRPAPSHELKQLRETASRSASRFVAFSRGAALEQASRRSCENRLEALSVIFDAISTLNPASDQTLIQSTTGTSFEVVKRKANEMISMIEPVDCYSFLGYITALALPALAKLNSAANGRELDQTRVITELTSEPGPLLSPNVIKQLGLGRKEGVIARSIKALRDEISRLAKDI